MNKKYLILLIISLFLIFFSYSIYKDMQCKDDGCDEFNISD